jgi:hypothetical protein
MSVSLARCSWSSSPSKFSTLDAVVKGYMKNILPKLGARDRTHAVMIAVKRGILDV